MFNSGFKASMDGSEDIFVIDNKVELPESFSYMKNLPPVLNQGNDPICVPCSLSAYFEYRLSLKSGVKNNSKFKLYDIFESRSGNTDGMDFKEAFDYVINTGAKYKNGIIKASRYYAVNNLIALRHAIVTNGPCIAGLPVYDSMTECFWIKDRDLEGYHAVAVVGYDANGFIIRNSWGSSYGYNGYSYVPNSDMQKALEIWTIC